MANEIEYVNFKDFVDSLPAAAESDLNSSNNTVINNASAGPKKLEAGAIGKASEMIVSIPAEQDVTEVGTVTMNKYMMGNGSIADSDLLEMVVIDLTDVVSIEFTAKFSSSSWYVLWLNASNQVVDKYGLNYTGVRTLDLTPPEGSKSVVINCCMDTVFSGKVVFKKQKVKTAVETINSILGCEKIKVNRLEKDSVIGHYDDGVDIKSLAVVTDGSYMNSSGAHVENVNLREVKIATAGYDALEITARFVQSVYYVIWLDDNGNVVDKYGENETEKKTIEFSVVQGSAYAVFNVAISVDFDLVGKTIVYDKVKDVVVTDSERIKEIEDEIAIYSTYNKKHCFGVVPSCKMPGLLSDYSWGSALTQYSEVISKFDELLVANYSSKQSIGYASDGQEMFVYKFKPALVDLPNSFANIPTIMIVCAQHGFEKGSTFGVWHLMKDVIENAADNDLLRYIKNNVNIFVVPVANPYGFDTSKYVNSNNVNINRNWLVPNWTYHYDEDNPSQNTGDSPFDQPETAAIRDFVLGHVGSIDLFFDHHTYGMGNVDAVNHLNWMSTCVAPVGKDVFYDRMKEIAVSHIQNYTSVMRTEFSDALLGISSTDGAASVCGTITYTTKFPSIGYADAWAITNNMIAYTVESFNGFPTGSLNTPDVHRGQEILLASLIQNSLHILSK